MASEAADIVVMAGTIDINGVIAGGVSSDWIKSIARMEIGEAHSYHVVKLLIVLEYYNTSWSTMLNHPSTMLSSTTKEIAYYNW